MKKICLFIMLILFSLIVSSCKTETEEVIEEVDFWEEFFANRTYTTNPDNQELLLHAQNNYGYFGDLIPFYNQEDRTLYMYYMIMTGGTPFNPASKHLSVSTDMFNFREQENILYDFVNATVNHYGVNGINPKNMFDFETYPDGYRDTYIFFDHQIERWRTISLSYITRGSVNRCALSTQYSDDKEGKVWTKSSTRLVTFPAYEEPECPCAMWINDRWYLFCSLSQHSIHNVGRPRYYIGDVGKSFEDQDWSTKEAHFIDGEDLCASQVIDVGGRYLLYGWIPQCRENEYFDGTNDYTLWGGAVSLMREIYQLPDCTLGTRLPGPLKEMIKKELLESKVNNTLNNEVIELSNKEIKSSCISFNASIANSSEFKITLSSEGKEYDIKFFTDVNGTVITLGSQQDLKHPIYSYYQVNKKLDEINVQIIIEGTVMEIFVNDIYSLTARTSLFTGTYNKVTASSVGEANISNFTINQLANSQNIYD